MNSKTKEKHRVIPLRSFRSERDFRTFAIRKLNRLPNVWCESISQRSISGTPDNILCVNGYFVAVEFKKSLKAPVSELQMHKLNKIINAGGLGFIMCPENFETYYDIIYCLSCETHE